MILRIVHMHFRAGELDRFHRLFAAHRDSIAAQPGCRRLELVESAQDPNTLSTVSLWDGQEELDAYRHSALFAEVWPATKALFAAPPQAESHTILWAS